MPTQTSNHSELRGWVVVLSASLFFFFEFVQLNSFNSLSESLMRTFNATAEQLSYASVPYFYGDLIFLYFAGAILDRISPARLILIAMGLSVICAFFLSQAQSLITIGICRFFTGIAAAFCFLSIIRIATRWFPPKRMALVIGVVVTMAMLGGFVAQTPIALLTIHVGWRDTFLITALAGLIMIILIASCVRDFPKSAYGQQEAQAQHHQIEALGFWKTLKCVASNKQNWLAGIYTSFTNLPVFILGAIWGGFYLRQIHHLSADQASHVTSMLFIGLMIGCPLIGWYSDHIGKRRPPMIYTALIALVAILAIMFIPALSYALAMALFLLLGIAISGQIISYPLIAESNLSGLTGSAEGLASVLIMGAGVVQPITGFLLDLYWNNARTNGVPLYSSSNFNLAFAVMPIAIVIAIIAVFFLRETYGKAIDEPKSSI